jgi:hypothetical protein
MKVALFNVDTTLCAGCSLTFRRFIGGINGGESLDVKQGKVVVRFGEAGIDEK